MKFYVGITDKNWFSLLKEDYNNGILGDVVNFWTPGTKREFKSIDPGDMFLFKLHNNRSTGENGEIVGGGYFLCYKKLDILDAWNRYGRGNGLTSLYDMQKALYGIKEKNNIKSKEIGCIILNNIFFLDKFIEEPSDWSKSIVSGKRYTTDTDIGKKLYYSVNKNKNDGKKFNIEFIDEIETEISNSALKGEERNALVKVRINQSVFRDRLLKKFNTCCLCSLENKELLTASHIKPWSVSTAKEKLDIDNGLLLCPNHDRLFDGGFISFDDDGSIIISDRLSELDCLFTNVNKSMKILLSDKSRKYMEYHRKEIFK